MNTVITHLPEISPLSHCALGDAYGFCFEFAKEDIVLRDNHVLDYPSESAFKTPRGAYSDDTQMSLALEQLLLEKTDWTPLDVARVFVECFQRDPRPGYAKGFFEFLKSIHSGEEFLQKIRPDSNRNGAAMRAPVLGVLQDVQQVQHLARLQATVTHNTTEGKDSAVVAALVSHYFIHNLGCKDRLTEYLNDKVPGYQWEQQWQGSVPVHGVNTVRAVLTAIARNTSLKALLKDCIAFTGDVDSVAAIALACASSSREFARDIPYKLWESLENGPYGRDYLLSLDKRALVLFAK